MEELNLKQIRLTNIEKTSCLQQSWISRRDKCFLFGERETSPEEVVRTIKKSRNGLRQINWCYFVCLSRSDVLYYCFLCPIHVQIYSANLLAPYSFCSFQRSGFPMFRLKLFRKIGFLNLSRTFPQTKARTRSTSSSMTSKIMTTAQPK